MAGDIWSAPPTAALWISLRRWRQCCFRTVSREPKRRRCRRTPNLYGGGILSRRRIKRHTTNLDASLLFRKDFFPLTPDPCQNGRPYPRQISQVISRMKASTRLTITHTILSGVSSLPLSSMSEFINCLLRVAGRMIPSLFRSISVGVGRPACGRNRLPFLRDWRFKAI